MCTAAYNEVVVCDRRRRKNVRSTFSVPLEKIKIRNAKIEEVTKIAEIERICFPAAEAASEAEFRERMEAFLENFFVAELDGRIIGFINGGTTNQAKLPDEMYHDISLHKPDGDVQTVFGLDVLPDYRGRGIAGKLLAYLVNVSRERGKKAVILTCEEHLIPFYERGGFVNHGVADSTHGGAKWYDMQQWFE